MRSKNPRSRVEGLKSIRIVRFLVGGASVEALSDDTHRVGFRKNSKIRLIRENEPYMTGKLIIRRVCQVTNERPRKAIKVSLGGAAHSGMAQEKEEVAVERKLSCGSSKYLVRRA